MLITRAIGSKLRLESEASSSVKTGRRIAKCEEITNC